MFDFIRHFLTPHHTNNHRAKVLHHQSLSVIVAFLLGLAVVLPSLSRQYPSVLGISVNISVQDLVSLTNQKRAAAGLPPLNYSQELSNAAAAKANYMLEKNFWAHVAPDGTTPWYFIKNAGYEYQYAGENLARGYNSASEVVDAWMASPTHRDNMLSSNYTDVGFAVTSGTLTGYETVLVVEEFGSRYVAKQNSVVQATAPTSAPTAPSETNSLETSEIAQVNPSPTQSPAPERANPVENTPQNNSGGTVAAVENKPLIDGKSTSKNISIFILLGLISVLIIDLVVIERKKVARVVAHNLDHIIFLGILLLAAIIIGGGAIL